MLLSFYDGNRIPGIAPPGFADEFYLQGPDFLSLDKYPPGRHFINLGLIQNSFDLNEVSFGDLVFRRYDEIGQITVIGQQNQAFGMIIQPSDRVYPFPYFPEEMTDCYSVLGIAECRDDAGGLVENKIDFLFHFDMQPSVLTADAVPVYIHRGVGIGDDLAVDFQFSIGDHFANVSAAVKSGELKKLLQGSGHVPGREIR
jgi:hypothetical protein